MEFACKVAGTKLLVVLGHTSCGAIKGACDHVRLGNLTALINKIEPAVAAVIKRKNEPSLTSENLDFVNEVAIENVHIAIENIKSRSVVLKQMEENDEIQIVGAMYDINDGNVTFMD